MANCWWPCCGVVDYLYAVGIRSGTTQPSWLQMDLDDTPIAQGGTAQELTAADVDADRNWYHGVAEKVLKLDSGNNLVLTTDATTGNRVIWDIAVNASGEIAYTASAVGLRRTGVFNADGTERWQNQYDGSNDDAWGVQWLPSGEVIFGGGYNAGTNQWGPIAVIKDASDGSKLDEIPAPSATASSDIGHAITVNADGDIWVIHGNSGGPKLSRYDSSLSLQWTESLTFGSAHTAFAFGVDSSGASYIPGTRSSDTSIVLQKRNADGSFAWSYLSNDGGHKVGFRFSICHPDGGIFAAGVSQTTGNQGSIQRFDSSGNFVWGGAPRATHSQVKHLAITSLRPNWW